LDIYDKRKKHHVKVLENEMAVLKYRKKFIEQILSKKIIIEKRKKSDIIQDLIDFKYPELSISFGGKSSYDYLTNLPLFSLTQEKIDELNKDYQEKYDELEVYRNTSIQDLWISELELFEYNYNKWFDSFEELKNDDDKDKSKTKKSNKSLTKSNSKINIVTDDKNDKKNKNTKSSKK
jgi:DNA topoisomerase-2